MRPLKSRSDKLGQDLLDPAMLWDDNPAKWRELSWHRKGVSVGDAVSLLEWRFDGEVGRASLSTSSAPRHVIGKATDDDAPSLISLESTTYPPGVVSRPFDLAMSDFFRSSYPTGVGSTSSSLLERVKLQDGAAWQRLVQLYAPLIYHWARHNRVPAADASDVVQEVFRSVVGNVTSFRRDRPGDSFRGWLYTITLNKVRDHFRYRGGNPEAHGGTTAHRQLQQVPEFADGSPSSCNDVGTAGAVCRRALELIKAEFSDRVWGAFWRVTVDGRPPDEVADDLGMTRPAVYQAKYRVLRRLRKELDDLIE